MLVCGDGALSSLTSRQLRGFEVRRTPGFDPPADPSLPVRCVVVCLPRLTATQLRALESLARRYPLSRIVLVTAVTAKTVRILARRPELLRNVIGVHEVCTELRSLITDVVHESFLERAAERLDSMLELPIAVKSYVRRVWSHPRPPTTVRAALAEVRLARSTLRDSWRALGLRAAPGDFVDWGLLVGALTWRRQGLPWGRVARHLGISIRRLRRIARRTVPCSLEQIDRFGIPWVEARFQDWLRHALST